MGCKTTVCFITEICFETQKAFNGIIFNGPKSRLLSNYFIFLNEMILKGY